ncbi:unnamed protein product [Amaranthus hypochondriacus]
MGCSVSTSLMPEKTLKRLTLGQNSDAISICKARLHLIKEAVKYRQAFADAHSKYIHSLSSVSSAIGVFITCYSSPPSNFIIAFANLENQEEKKEERDCEIYEDFVDDFGVNCVESECKWDFFNMIGNIEKKVKEEREIKGKQIRVCKEEEQRKENGKELMEALKDVEVQFCRAFQSGLEVSKMLEIDKFSSHPTFHDIKDNASKKQSVSSQYSFKSSASSSSTSTSSTEGESGCDPKSSITCTSDTSSTWTEIKSDPYDCHSGMVSGSHSSTLGRLCVWEKKLSHEIKAGLQTRKIYKQQCSRLQRQNNAEEDDLRPSKVSSEANDLYHQMLVTLKHSELISKQIERLRDDELQPQLFELLQGLMRNWNSMSKTHEIQNVIMRETNTFNSLEQGQFCSGSQRQATRQLESAIHAWYTCFSDYISAQKSYVESLYGWLSKFIDAEDKYSYNSGFSLPPTRFNGPTLIVTCQRWSIYLERLPIISLKRAMKSLEHNVHALWVQQGLEQQQKQKVDGLDEEINRKLHAYGKAEEKALTLKSTVQHSVNEQTGHLDEKRNQLDMLRQKVEIERDRHQSIVLETERIIIKTLQVGFSSVFESLAEFSRATAKVYADLVTLSHDAR